LTWTPRNPVAPGFGLSKREAQKQSGTYNAAIPANIAYLDLSLPANVLANAAEAEREITRFDTELGTEIAPFASVLLRSESAASSQIENLTASARAIAEAEVLGDRSKHNATIIVSNTAAMKAAVALADRINGDAILAMHDALMIRHNPGIAGKWRTEQVWIGGSSHGPRGATFIAPHHSRVPASIDDLITFTQRTDLPALVQIAVAHAQFETIHPFPDGNGRTGRALIQSMLRHTGLTRQVTVPVSAGLLSDTGTYFAALTAYREGDVAPIIQRLADASLLAAANGRQLVDALRAVRKSWADKITARSNSAVHKVADLLLRRPVLDAKLVEEQLGIKHGNAVRYLTPLVEAGVIVESTTFKRNRIWRAPEVLTALDAFADRAGRRGW